MKKDTAYNIILSEGGWSMKNKKKLLIPIVLIIAIVIIAIIFSQMSKKELLSVKSERQLMKIYEGYDNYSSDYMEY